MKLTVFYDGSFWCAVIEVYDYNQNLKVFKHFFSSEPSNIEVYEFVVTKMDRIISQDWYVETFGQHASEHRSKRINPKRMQRLVNKEKNQLSLSSQSQDAMKLQLEAKKKLSKEKCSIDRIERKKEQFLIKQEKRKKKRKGK